MATLVVSNAGERYLLRRTLGLDVYDPLFPDMVHLFDNDYTPTKDVVIGDLTEASYSGYAPVDLDAALWTDPATIDGAAVSWYTTAALEFFTSSGLTVQYGYYVTDSTGLVLLWVLRFDAPQTGSPTLPILAQPTISGRSENEPV